MPVNGFDGHEQRKAYRNHHMPACVTISGRHARKSDRCKFNPCNRHQDRNTHFFRRLIMTHNNKLAQAIPGANTHAAIACASFFGMAVSTTDTLHMVAMPTILAAARGESNTQVIRAAAPTFGLHQRVAEYPARRRVSHHKSCGNTNMTTNAQRAPVFPHSKSTDATRPPSPIRNGRPAIHGTTPCESS